MATVTSLGSSFTTTAGAKTVVATPAVGDLIVIVCANSGRTTAQAPTVTDNNTGGQGTYNQVKSATCNTSADSMWYYVRTSLIRSATSTTFTFTPLATDTGGGLDVCKVTGMAMAGGNAIRQSGSQNNQGAGTPAPVLPASALTTNPLIGSILNLTSPAGLTARSSPAWTELVDLGYTVPTNGLEVASIDSGETAATITWGGASASAFCSIVVELDITVPVVEVSMGTPMGY